MTIYIAQGISLFAGNSIAAGILTLGFFAAAVQGYLEIPGGTSEIPYSHVRAAFGRAQTASLSSPKQNEREGRPTPRRGPDTFYDMPCEFPDSNFGSTGHVFQVPGASLPDPVSRSAA